MSPSLGLGGRVMASRAAPIARPLVAARVFADTCVTEDYDGADASVYGYDQSWIAYTSGAGATGRVRGNALALAGSASGTTKKFFARCEADCASPDMTVTAAVNAVAPSGFTAQTWGVLARMHDFAADGTYPADPTSFANGDFTGWHFYASNDGGDLYVGLDFAYYRADFPIFTGIGSAYTPEPGNNLGATPLVAGDELSITVTGTGDDTHVVCKINGSTVIDMDALSDFNADLGGDAEYILTQPMNAEGARGGVSLQATSSSTWGSGVDDDVRLDDFEACAV